MSNDLYGGLELLKPTQRSLQLRPNIIKKEICKDSIKQKRSTE